MGRVIAFRPDDSRMPYPDDWYNNAAVTVQEMHPPFSIHAPENIREYYRRLFAGTTDKPELTKAMLLLSVRCADAAVSCNTKPARRHILICIFLRDLNHIARHRKTSTIDLLSVYHGGL